MAEFKVTSTHTINCPTCKNSQIVKVGKRNNQQRFKCNTCNKRFRANGKMPGRKFNDKQIGATIRDYYMGLSYKQLSESMRDRYNIPKPAKDTLYDWVQYYTNKASYMLKGVKAHTGDHWVADEMFIKVGGKMVYHWNIMDVETRYLLASHLAEDRTEAEAAKTLRKALAVAHHPPKTITTDGLASYIPAIKAILPKTEHIRAEGIRAKINNNMSERMQGTFRSRIKTLRGLDSIESGQRYLDGYDITYNFFREHSSLKYNTPAQAAGVKTQITQWADVVRSKVEVPKEEQPKARQRVKQENLPKDLTARKGVQRRRRKAARKAEVKERKKPDVLDGTEPLFDRKTFKMPQKLKRVYKKASSDAAKARRMNRQKPLAPQPVMPELKPSRKVAVGPLERSFFDPPKLPTPKGPRPKPAGSGRR